MTKKKAQPKVTAPLLKCKHCTKTFKRAGGLGVHVKTQHPETQLTQSQYLVYSMGRPSKYEPRFADMLIDHFNIEKFEKVEMESETRYSAKTGVKVSEKKKYKLVPNDLPTFEAFARKIGVSQDTIVRWATQLVDPEADDPVYKYPDFHGAYNVAKAIQKEFLVDNGLKGNYPPASFIFVTKNVTDMTDKQIIETNDADYKDKENALDKWFDTIRDHAKSTRGDTATDATPAEDVQA